MAGSLLVCQQIQASEEEIKKIAGGSFLSPSDVGAAKDSTQTDLQRDLAATIKAAREREAAAARTQKISGLVAAGSLLVAVTGLWLSWRSKSDAR